MTHEDAVEGLYQQLSIFVRRSSDVGRVIHPDLSLVAYTILTLVESAPGSRAADVAAALGLDKSTVSRHIESLVSGDLLLRGAEQPGRRGNTLSLTGRGQQNLDAAACRIRSKLADWLADWDEADIDRFARLFVRFNDSTA